MQRSVECFKHKTTRTCEKEFILFKSFNQFTNFMVMYFYQIYEISNLYELQHWDSSFKTNLEAILKR
jgi:hypothetical protein